jgi:hypothetical protein
MKRPGKVTIELDLTDFGTDLEYDIEDEIKTAVRSIVRDHIKNVLLRDVARKGLQQWTKEYLEGKHPADPEGVVTIPIPVAWLKSDG